MYCSTLKQWNIFPLVSFYIIWINFNVLLNLKIIKYFHKFLILYYIILICFNVLIKLKIMKYFHNLIIILYDFILFCLNVFLTLTTMKYMNYMTVSETHHLLIFCQHQVISAQSHTEDDGCYSLKAMDPFLPLWPLTSHIKHPEERRE